MADDDIVPTVDIDQEEWRPIPGLPYFEASSIGRVRSMARTVSQRNHGHIVQRFCETVIRTQHLLHNAQPPYFVFNARPGKSNYRYNRAVCAAFHGAPPTPRHEAAHLDGNSLNNVPSNLAWKTPAENGLDKVRHGTPARGVRHSKARFSDADIVAIFAAYASGSLQAEIAAAFGIDQGTIGCILLRKTWMHVFIEPEIIAKARFMAKENHYLVLKARNKAMAASRAAGL